MKLTELNPHYGQTDGVRTHIVFDCPKCRTHEITVPIIALYGKTPWGHSGKDFETTTLTPSVLHKTHYADEKSDVPRYCESHFFITNGEVINA